MVYGSCGRSGTVAGVPGEIVVVSARLNSDYIKRPGWAKRGYLMYEIGRVYIWQNQTGKYARINGVECTPTESPARYRHNATGQIVWSQPVTNVDGERWLAMRGDLRPKNPPAGERSITDMFKVPQHEPT
jgi:hypothetical protein